MIDTSSYANNRRTDWGYDADGRNTSIDTRTYAFDAAGQMVNMTGQQWLFNHYTTVSQSSGYDGDGMKAQEVANGVTTYYLTSSALRGAIIEEMSNTGQKNVGFVYAGGPLLAKQSANEVTWKHPTPAGTSEYLTFNDISNSGRNEFDPLGADLALQYTPPPENPENDGDIGAGHFGGIMDARWSDFFNINAGCTMDGVSVSCSMAMSALNSGAAVEGVRGAVFNLSTRTFDYVGELYPDPLLGYSVFDAINLGSMGTIGHGGQTPDTYSVNLAGVNDSSVTIFAGTDFVSSSPQNSGSQQSSNKNCILNALSINRGLARTFGDVLPNGTINHPGVHGLAPLGERATVSTLPALTGEVLGPIHIGGEGGGDGSRIVDVLLDNGNVAIYADLVTVNVHPGQRLNAGTVIGTVGGSSNPKDYSGLHFGLLKGNGNGRAADKDYRSRTARGLLSPVGNFIDPLGPNSPVNCPGVTADPAGVPPVR